MHELQVLVRLRVLREGNPVVLGPHEPKNDHSERENIRPIRALGLGLEELRSHVVEFVRGEPFIEIDICTFR